MISPFESISGIRSPCANDMAKKRCKRVTYFQNYGKSTLNHKKRFKPPLLQWVIITSYEEIEDKFLFHFRCQFDVCILRILKLSSI